VFDGRAEYWRRSLRPFRSTAEADRQPVVCVHEADRHGQVGKFLFREHCGGCLEVGIGDVRVGGHVQAMLISATLAVPQANGGKVTALAVTSDQRLAQLPGVPTFAEAGYPDFKPQQ